MTTSLNLILKVGDGRLRILRLRGREAISSFFQFTIDAAEQPDADLSDSLQVGATASLLFMRDGEEVRAVHGILDNVLVTRHAAGRAYTVTLVPRAWRSTLITTQQIFMDMTMPEVIGKKLALVGLRGDAIVTNLLIDYPTQEFIVQYRETDANFLGRLAEHRGISFYFNHTSGSDRIVFTDHNDGFERKDEIKSIAFSHRLDEPDTVHELCSETRAVPKLYVAYDYNYRTPRLALKAQRDVEGGLGGGLVEYGCHIKTPEEGEALAFVRSEELRTRQHRYRGQSSIPLLSAGLRTQLEGAEEMDGELLISAVEHHGEPVDGAMALSYRNSFEAVPVSQTFRPERRHRKPVVSGIVTGIVQGHDGTNDSEAVIDEEGRYVVQFHFDSALGKLNAKASRAVRMAQPFAGSSEGMHFPLRPGTEVALAFVDGDPDRPIIVGALPNHSKRSVVTSTDSTVNRIETSTGLIIQFGGIK